MTRRVRRGPVPGPFLKWAGGKRQLLGELMARVDALGEFGRYHEPFVGGGALFFELARKDRLGQKRAYLSDANPRLIEAYQGIKENVEQVIALLCGHQERHCKEYYYDVRAHVPDTVAERAARIVYFTDTVFSPEADRCDEGRLDWDFRGAEVWESARE